MLVLLTWRPEDLDTPGEVFRIAVEGISGVTVVGLDRLDPATVRALVTAATGAGLPPWDPEALVAESEGLPLYLAEALVAGPGEPGDAPPRGVRALLLERLASVGETAAQVLSAAAVIGRSFDLDIVRDAAGPFRSRRWRSWFAGRSSARS